MLVELAMNGVDIDSANFTAVGIIDAVIDPSGWAMMKLPLTTLTWAPAIGVLFSPLRSGQ
ncbi:hypothetical protein JCM19237_931 [Photobacterium aphoticum]|uniref:Uncharacterized protein n=1 Tax=Photobacterium aphoticum TaxID=754436 RepID=A0A090QZJ6_9GAMM|nr:hypothetical protein JCM19237_931 [Photobacterium aphoticum]